VDDSSCLFVMLASMLTFAMPVVAQPVFAMFAAALVLAARITPAPRAGRRETGRHRRAVG
jgi:hypothetical protein